MHNPSPKQSARVGFKFSVNRTTNGDYHAGVICRHISMYAKDDFGEYCATLVILALFKCIIQFGITFNKKPRRFSRDIIGR